MLRAAFMRTEDILALGIDSILCMYGVKSVLIMKTVENLSNPYTLSDTKLRSGFFPRSISCILAGFFVL